MRPCGYDEVGLALTDQVVVPPSIVENRRSLRIERIVVRGRKVMVHDRTRAGKQKQEFQIKTPKYL